MLDLDCAPHCHASPWLSKAIERLKTQICEPMPQPLTSRRASRLSGRIRVPGDKSISHRALILGARATGRTRISGLLEAEDVVATATAIAALGADVVKSNGVFEVAGQGVGGLRAPRSALDFGNSG